MEKERERGRVSGMPRKEKENIIITICAGCAAVISLLLPLVLLLIFLFFFPCYFVNAAHCIPAYTILCQDRDTYQNKRDIYCDTEYVSNSSKQLVWNSVTATCVDKKSSFVHYRFLFDALHLFCSFQFISRCFQFLLGSVFIFIIIFIIVVCCVASAY